MTSIIRRIINPSAGPKAIGPYSKGVLVDKTLYLSGQIGFDPETMKLVDGGVAEQARQALKNMGDILEDAGCSYENVVKVTIYLTDIKDYPTVNDIYATFFKEKFPARTCFQAAALPASSSVEIDAIAVLGPIIDK